MQLSLRRRVMITNTLLILTAMGLVSYILLSYLSDVHLNTYRRNFTSEAHVFAEQSIPFLNQESAAELNDLTAQYSRLLDLRVTVIAPDGKVLSDSSIAPELMDNHFTRPEIMQALTGNDTTSVRYSDTLQTEMLFVAVPIVENNQILGAARFSIPISSVSLDMRFIRQIILGAGLLATLLGLLLSIPLTHYTVRPLSELSQKVQYLKNHSAKNMVPSTRHDEIGQLDREFIVMATQLGEQIDALKVEQSKLNAVLGNMTDGILIINDSGKVELINNAAQNMFNIDEKRAFQSSIVEVVRNHQIVDTWEKCRDTDEQQVGTFQTSPERMFLQVVVSDLGQALPRRSLMLINDLTNIQKLEMVRRDFISNVSHELRTPLASLKSLNETLIDGAMEDPPAAQKFLLLMEEEIDNMTQIVLELLELSRIESGRVPLKRLAIRPYDLLERPVERMKFQAQRSEIELILDCDEHLPTVFADKERIGQVLINLIHNAIKFTPKGGTITVSAYSANPKVVFMVRDTGVGIEEHNLKRIFERFYKEDRARSGEGTGLGLSISRHTVHAHGGEIWAESTLNEGSTIYFSLPEA